jgi:hypothetical protein
MNLRPIIDEIASQAEDFLKGITDRKKARAELTEFIALDYAGLSADDRKIVTDAVMAFLQEENVFEGGFAGHSFADEAEAEVEADTDEQEDET